MHVDTTMIQYARKFALQAHGDQTYGTHPYVIHLEHVQDVLTRFGYESADLQIAAWLHDILEDTAVTQDMLTQEFTASLADIVLRVTDEEGATRSERKAKTYPKIKGHQQATIIKLCDRIANTEASLKNNPDKLALYTQEYRDFRTQLYVAGMADALWDYLDQIYDRL